jgi:myo-inositol-1(or 4)-monophosphatase
LDDRDVAIAVAQQGAAVVRRRFGASLSRIDKGAGDFATDADVEAERAMLAVLRRERSEDGVVAEESGRSGVTGSPRTWLLDPLCGTLNYAAGMRVAAVNVALRRDGRCLAAAVADPFSDEVFWSVGNGAFVRAGGHDTRLAPDARSRLIDLNLDPPFPSAPTLDIRALAVDPGFESGFRLRVVSSSLALTWVACGRRAAYVTDGDIRDSMHFAAGLTVCEAAGCVVTDLAGRDWRSGTAGLVATADRETHAVLLARLRAQT